MANLNKTHGDSNTRLYQTWRSVVRRCTNPKNSSYAFYGGRGIRLYGGWRYSYRRFRDWALANGYSNDLTIERIDNNGPYSPENCTWATRREQARNTRRTRWATAWGESKCLMEWTEDARCVVSGKTLNKRLDKGWRAEQAISTPSQRVSSPA
jgi:hypothetical protein